MSSILPKAATPSHLSHSKIAPFTFASPYRLPEPLIANLINCHFPPLQQNTRHVTINSGGHTLIPCSYRFATLARTGSNRFYPQFRRSPKLQRRLVQRADLGCGFPIPAFCSNVDKIITSTSIFSDAAGIVVFKIFYPFLL